MHTIQLKQHILNTQTITKYTPDQCTYYMQQYNTCRQAYLVKSRTDNGTLNSSDNTDFEDAPCRGTYPPLLFDHSG